MGHGCVSLGVRQVPWVLPRRRGHFALVFTRVRCPRLPGRDGRLRRMPGMPGYPGGIGRRHGPSPGLARQPFLASASGNSGYFRHPGILPLRSRAPGAPWGRKKRPRSAPGARARPSGTRLTPRETHSWDIVGVAGCGNGSRRSRRPKRVRPESKPVQGRRDLTTFYGLPIDSGETMRLLWSFTR